MLIKKIGPDFLNNYNICLYKEGIKNKICKIFLVERGIFKIC